MVQINHHFKQNLHCHKCIDDVCLLEAMYVKTPIIVITNDIDISNKAFINIYF